MTGDRIGDALIKWPVVAALKRAMPAHRLVWLAGRRTSVFAGRLAPLVRGIIDEVHETADIGVSWRELLRAPLAGQFATIIGTEPKIRSALLLKRIQHEIFISPAANFRLSDRKPTNGSAYPKTVFGRMRCLASLAAGCELEIDTRIDVGPARIQSARALLPDGHTYIGLAPGAGGVRKRWPLDRYITVARLQTDRGRVPVFFLGPAEATWQQEIATAVPGALFPEQSVHARAQGDILLSIALGQRLAVGITNDAGGGHVLAAGGRPMIALFGRTSEEKFKPPYGKRIVVSAREYGGKEMSLIPITRVVAEIDRVLNEAQH